MRDLYNSGVNAIFRTMKRFLACLLMLVLPLQSAWAVTGAFCGDAGMAAATQANGVAHHGHHDHDAATAESAEQVAQTSTGCSKVPDGHCAACHAGCGAIVRADFPPAAGADDAPDTTTRQPLASPARQRPERPKWSGRA